MVTTPVAHACAPVTPTPADVGRDPPSNTWIPASSLLFPESEAARAPDPTLGAVPRPGPRAIVVSARDRLADPAHWLHGDPQHEAVDADGRGCLPWDPQAVRWDLWGALGAARGTLRATDIAVQIVAREVKLVLCDVIALSEWQDAPERTHAEILAVLGAAIPLAPERA